ncbi:hypothetical protein A9320_28135 [Ruegeria sp. PBVC088]|nr:hypothetical protein A9320_28135 [Ruegeria sp. PBVC088]
MSEEWGPWIEHDGMGTPVPEGTRVEVEDWGGRIYTGQVVGREPLPGEVDVWDWRHCISQGRPQWLVKRYRIRKPRGLTMLQQIARDAKCPQKVDA